MGMGLTKPIPYVWLGFFYHPNPFHQESKSPYSMGIQYPLPSTGLAKPIPLVSSPFCYCQQRWTKNHSYTTRKGGKNEGMNKAHRFTFFFFFFFFFFFSIFIPVLFAISLRFLAFTNLYALQFFWLEMKVGNKL